ncbi:hypothetical protein HELRODRAFT_75616, partial [Helobdella robusta]|uniref:ADP-ribosyl cyclase/cyclic ADP-ribose hydrolase n=1 Tax=Helobdella robusta TaxID=6412 RepID=T1G274_HELRO
MHSKSNWHSFPSAGERATLPSKHRRHFLSLKNYKFNENEEIAKKAKRDLLKTNLEKAEPLLEKSIKQLATSKSKKEKLKILSDMLASIDRAWSLPSIGRDLAYKLCDVLRNCNGIDLLLTFLSPEKQEAQAGYDTSVLAQSMTVPNRKYVANYKNGLDIIISVADRYRDDPDVTRAVLGILECLFKHTEETCTKLINCGGLDAVLYACRYFDVSVLRPCAVALANLALYGDDSCQQSMITKNAPEWLFPLAFSEDDGVKYYAFLAIAALGANKSLEVAVAKSGTLHLVEPFVRIRDPVEFGTSDRAHMHGHAVDWLARLVPLLRSKRVEVQSLVTFHFAMEAAIRNRQGRLEIFKELNIIDTMKELSKSNIKLPAKFSNKFLEIIGEQPVMVLSPQIMLWNTDDICVWLTEVTITFLLFFHYYLIQRFKQDKIDIDLFLQLNDEDLKNDYGIERAIERKKFLRGLTKLKQTASYDSSEIVISAIDDFLKSLGPEYRQYVYQMSRSGVESSILRSLTEENLLKDCGVTNGVHRLRILEAAKSLNLNSCSNNNGNYRLIEKSLDVFISYRRSNGSQLASLLKVHLQLRGFSVFLDIEKLPAGKFDDSLITSIHSSRNFILVLTPNALDRCIGDVDCKDWIHREIVAAMNGGCNIIPVIDNFVFPSAESLPEDIKNISYFNGIRWIHDYQDACVDKLEQFING